MPDSLTLRRLSTDSQWVLKRLAILEDWVARERIESWGAVVLAEWARKQGATENERGPSQREHLDLFLDPVLLAAMKGQADGPWEVYVAQAKGELQTLELSRALRDLYAKEADMAVTEEDSLRQPQTLAYRFDVAISYAGSDRDFVQRVVGRLQRARLRVFYDDDEHNRAAMVGRDLDQEIVRIYQRESAYCLAFLSAAYATGEWTRAELRAVLGRLGTQEGYFKPVRLDNTQFPDVPKALVYFDARQGQLLSDSELLSELILDSFLKGGPLESASGPEAAIALANSGGTEKEVCEYFDTVLPAMIRWKKGAATAIGASIHFSIIGRINYDWLVSFEAPEASVRRLVVDNDPNIPILARHLRLRASARTMLKILKGDFDARRALIEGTVELAGEVTLLKEISALFKGSDSEP